MERKLPLKRQWLDHAGRSRTTTTTIVLEEASNGQQTCSTTTMTTITDSKGQSATIGADYFGGLLRRKRFPEFNAMVWEGLCGRS